MCELTLYSDDNAGMRHTLVNWDNVVNVEPRTTGPGSVVFMVNGTQLHVLESLAEIENRVSIWRNGR